jgi:uncharacterized protein YndB with AHSA1/START domain
LTEPAFTERYWGATLHSDWTVGSTFTIRLRDVAIADPAQVILEAEPYRRLAYTWHSFTPELAQAYGFSDKFIAKASSEQRSKVTFDIEPTGPNVRLTVIHDGFGPDGAVLKSISRGWPRILSNLKTLPETGEVLPA